MVALALVGQGEGNMAAMTGGVTAEHRLDVRCVGVDVRHHHHHVSRSQAGIGVEGRQQLVVQDFHLPLWAVGFMKSDGVILRQIQRPLLLAGLPEWRQVVDIVLDLVQ